MVDLGLPGFGVPVLAPLEPVRVVVSDGARAAEVRLLDLALACCSVEVAAALQGGTAPAEVPPEGSRPVLVVAGTCTEALAPAVRAAYDALPEGAQVVSFGACACSGGPYWDSYCVVPGIGDLVPVDLFVPGCPPRPDALVSAVLDLALGAR